MSPAAPVAKTTHATKRQLRELDRLADWLLDESVSFRKLDEFRQRLRLEESSFAKLLGASERTYRTWRRDGRVPLRRRDFMHEEVLGYRSRKLASGDTPLDPM
jgi:DNA-binding transcriptional regulator YiaG